MNKLIIKYKGDKILDLNYSQYEELRTHLLAVAELLEQTGITFDGEGKIIVRGPECSGIPASLNGKVFAK